MHNIYAYIHTQYGYIQYILCSMNVFIYAYLDDILYRHIYSIPTYICVYLFECAYLAGIFIYVRAADD